MKLKMDGRKIKCIIPALFLICIGAANLSAQESRIRPRESEAALEAFLKTDLLTEEDFEYDLTRDGNGIRLTKYLGNSTCIRIPDEIDDIPVTELSENLFEYDPDAESIYDYYYDYSNPKKTVTLVAIYIPDSVKKISSFEGQKNLKYVRLPANLKEIPQNAFCNCSSLEEIFIPDSVRLINDKAFENSGLKSIDFPDGVSFSDGNVCSNCENLTKVTLPAGLKKIPLGMFSNCNSLSEIELPDSVTEIEKRAFASCDSLKNISVSSHLLEIGDEAFSGCVALTEFVIPESVRSLGYNAFRGTGMHNLYIPDSVQKIGASSIDHETGYVAVGENFVSLRIPNWITKLEGLPDGVKIINFPTELQVFKMDWFSEKCVDNLEDIVIPDSLTDVSFGYDTFSRTKLPIKTQKRLRELGYTGSFGGTRPAKKTGQ